MKKLTFHTDRVSSSQTACVSRCIYPAFSQRPPPWPGRRRFALDLSQLDTAEAELESLVTEWQAEWKQKANPETARELAVSLQALGMVERQAGKPDEALGHLTTACDLLATQAPEMLADAREAKALTLQDLGRLADSENLLRQVLASRQETPPA